ncbi:agmatinase [uncultured Eudoraea sp.]|uniref:agmatinase n=1 Tax=uncultured Eudoraea sp. TaxID=1035614 RepID=UPI002617EAD5|nr:agmatinase [uncultured Eudoraea sp.]
MKKIILQGILYDEKSSYLKGPALAPPKIRSLFMSPSANYFAENGREIAPEIFDDKGDFEIDTYFDIENLTFKNLKNSEHLLTLGGDHSITYPVIKAFNRIHGRVDVIHIDAHADLYDIFEGDKFSHACPFARIMEEKLINRLIQIGIRTLSMHQREQSKKYDVETIEMRHIHKATSLELKNPVYISLDMDVLDPAYAPGVSHHEPGGLSTRELLNIIQAINVPIFGADIVEYNPTRDINDITGMVCAKLIKELAAKMIENN